MVVSKLASIRIVALAVILAGTVWQPLRAGETATQDTSDHASCARSTFRVLVDVGHTATSPGADSARGVPEYEFNLKLADVIAQSLREAGFDKTVRLVTSGTRLISLFRRAASADHLHADLFLSIHHDSVHPAVGFNMSSERPGRLCGDKNEGSRVQRASEMRDVAGLDVETCAV